MKSIKKVISIFLAILTLFSICSTSTTVFAAEYTEQKARTEYFDSALSGYLKNIVDTEDAVRISEKEQVDEIVEEVNSSVEKAASTFSLRAIPTQSTETAKEASEDLDIDHTRLTLELEDGENVAYLFSEPVSFIDDAGNLVYKDTNIRAVTDTTIINRGYSYENGDNDYKAYFSQDSSKGLFLVEKDGEEIRLVPNGTRAVGTVEQIESDMELVDSFEYAGVYGTDTVLRFLPQLNGCKEEIVLSSYQGISDFSFTLYTEEGTIAAINSNGEVEIIDSATKDIITTFVSPFANDSSGGMDVTSEHYTDCTYELEMISEGKYILTISVPKEYLESESTVYPVVIDPTTDNISMTYDTSVYSSRSDSPQGSNPSACFGKTGTSEYGKGRAMFYFKIPSDIEKYAKISSAKLWLREVTARSETMYVRPYLIKDSWNNSVTWDTQPAYYSTCSYPTKSGLSLPRKNINSASADKDGSPYLYAFNIIYAVKAWTTGTTNRGLMFIAECEASDGDYLWRGFATKEYTTSSYRPYAVITYTNDTTKPTISSVSGNPTEWTKNDVTLTVTATDNVYKEGGISKYSFDNGSTWQTSKKKTFTKNQTVYIKVKDLAGNISDAKTVKITKIDKTAPTISKVAVSPTGWTNGSVKVTVTASDSASGLAAKAYSFDNGSTWQADNYKSYSSNNSSINVKVRDAVGNITSYGSNPVKITNIDKTAPTISSVSGNPTTCTNSNVTLKVTANDTGGSGVAGYSFDNGSTWQTSNAKTFTSNQTVNIKVKDGAGNVSSVKSIAITYIDKTAPTVSVSSVATSAATKVTITASDSSACGLHSTPYSFDNGSTWQSSNIKYVTNTTTLTIKVRDKAGNIKSLSHTPSAVLPITITPYPVDWTNGSVRLTVTGTGISQYKFDNDAFSTSNSKDYSENCTVSIVVKDTNGQTKTVTYTITNIDKVSPEITDVNVSEITWTNNPVTVNVVATDKLSGIAAYSFDNGVSWQTENEKTFNKSENEIYPETIIVKVKDKAGNISQWDEISLAPMDTVSPSAPDLYEEDGLVYISSRSFNFDENTDSPEHIEYRLENSDWIDYDGEPLSVIRSSDTTIYARICDEAGNISDVASFSLESGLGKYTASYADIALGEGVLPIGFDRTYTSENGWFFTFEANVAEYTNGYVFTDFYGNKHYFVSNAEGKYVSAYGDELKVEEGTLVDTDYSYVVPYGKLDCYFNEEGKLAVVKDNYNTATYTWVSNNIYITDEASNTNIVRLSSGRPIYITASRFDSITNSTLSKNVQYQWTNGVITKFTDADGVAHSYTYNEQNLLTNDGLQEIVYSAEGRVKLVSQLNGAFVKYTYNDLAASADAETPGNIGAVTVSDSKGMTDTLYYADGFVVSNNIGSYSENAVYEPNNISSDIIADNISQISYTVDASEEETAKEQTYGDYPLYEEDDDCNFTFYDYDGENNITATLFVKSGVLTVTEETTFEQAEAVAEEKTTYSYDINGNVTEKINLNKVNGIFVNREKTSYSYNDKESVVTQAVCQWLTDAWYQTYGEEYTYNDYGNITSQITTVYTNTTNTETNLVETTSDSNTVIYEYDVWCQQIKETNNAGAADETVSETSYDVFGRATSVIVDGETTFYTYDGKGNILTVIEGEEVTTYTYSDEGNLISRTNPNGTVASYVYDSYGNLTNHAFNGYAFTYNTLGSILTASSESGQLVNYIYSSTVEQDVLNADFGNGQSIAYDYNEEGEITAIKLGEETKYGYEYLETTDENGEVTKEWTELTDYVSGIKKVIEESKLTVNDLNGNFIYSVESVSKDEEVEDSFDGTVTTIGSDVYTLVTEENKDTFKTNGTTDFTKEYTYVNDELSNTQTAGITTSYGYNAEKLVSVLENTLNDVSKVYGYAYDENGNITTETLTTTSKDENGATVETNEAIHYTYDDKEQLISAETSTIKYEYTYDDRGNMLTKKEYSISLDENNQKVYTLIETSTDTYVYDETWKDKLISYNGQSITYDAVGNPTNYMGNTLTWTMGRQLATFGDISYTYNEDGIRTSKTSNGVTTKFYLDGTNIIEQTDGITTLYFFYDSVGEIVGFKYNGNNYIYVKNSMGDIVGIADAAGNLVVSYTYDAWGKVTSVTGSNTAIGELNPFRYRSYYYDSDIELYYLQSRYYDVVVGRFINCDDVNYIGVTESEVSYNPFAYCENNPTNDVDPTGHLSLKSLKQALEKAINAIKKWASTIWSKIKSEAKRFLQIIKYKKGELSISTTASSLVFDSVITACSKTTASAMSAFGFSLNIAKKFAKNKLEDFFKKQMVPYITRGYVNTFLTNVRKIFWKFVSKSTNAALEYATAYTTDKIYGRFDGYDIVSMFSSWGSFISVMLDVIDGEEDDYITIRRA